jgi:hypothetical protein
VKPPNGTAWAYFGEHLFSPIAHEGWPFSRLAGGYGKVWHPQRRRLICVHVLACELAHGPRPAPGMQAAHSCRVPACFWTEHVAWKTPVENEADKVLHGTKNVGLRNGNGRLTDEQVLSIFRDHRGRLLLADLHGVTPRTIDAIRAGRSHAALTADLVDWVFKT